MQKPDKAANIAAGILTSLGKPTDPLDFASKMRLKQELELQRDATKQAQRKLHTFRNESKKVEQQVGELNQIEKAPVTPFNITPSISSGLSETVPVLLLSDWHWEEPVLAGAVRGINEYNPTIYKERFNRLIRKAVNLVNYRRKTNTRIDEMVIWFGGDFITGHIHDENKMTSAVSPPEASIVAQGDLKFLIEEILRLTGIKRLIIPCNVGNHARTTEKTWIGTMARTNFEAMIYHSLQMIFKNDPRVHFILPAGQFTEYRVFDKFNIRFSHGDAIKFGGGIGGLMVPMKKRIAAWNADHNEAYMDCMGHWHTFTPNRRFIVNGSMIGYNTYAQWLGFAPEDPIQTLFYIERQHGLTAVEPIYLNK